MNNFDSIYEGPPAPIVSASDLSGYLARVMGWMVLGLFVTAFMSIATLFIKPLSNLIFFTGWGHWVVYFAQLGVVIALTARLGKMNSSTATFMFMLYSVLTGITLSTIFVLYDLFSIVIAFGVTGVLFLLMSIYGQTTKKDLSGWGSILFFGLLGLIIASVVNIFMGGGVFDIIVSSIGVIIFVGLVAYDSQKLKTMYTEAVSQGHQSDGAMVHKLAIMGALQLYLDFINIFLYILRLLGSRRK